MMLTNFTIDTGSKRHVVGHAISGGLAAGILASAVSAKRYKDGKINKQKAIRDTLKNTAIGAVATASAISASNSLGDRQKSIFQVFGAIALGGAAIYGIEKAAQKQEDKLLTIQGEQDGKSK